MGLQTLYFTNTNSVLTPIASMKTLAPTYGTLNTSSTSIAEANSVTVKFIPNTTNNGTTATVSSTPTSQGWMYETGFPGRYWPGTYGISIAVSNSGGLYLGSTMQLKANIFVVAPSSSSVSANNNFLVGTLTSATVTENAATQTATATLAYNNFLEIGAGQFLYAEIYLTYAGQTLTTTSLLNLNSASSYITTPFFEPLSSQYKNSSQ